MIREKEAKREEESYQGELLVQEQSEMLQSSPQFLPRKEVIFICDNAH
jgi:hypothetical protein